MVSLFHFWQTYTVFTRHLTISCIFFTAKPWLAISPLVTTLQLIWHLQPLHPPIFDMESVRKGEFVSILIKLDSFLPDISFYHKTGHVSPPDHTSTHPTTPTPSIHPLLMKSVKNDEFVSFFQKFHSFKLRTHNVKYFFHHKTTINYISPCDTLWLIWHIQPFASTIIDGI